MVSSASEIWLNQNLGLGFGTQNLAVNLSAECLMFWLGFTLLKHDFGLQKIFFVQFLIKTTPVEFCIFDINFIEILIETDTCRILYFCKILIF